MIALVSAPTTGSADSPGEAGRLPQRHRIVRVAVVSVGLAVVVLATLPWRGRTARTWLVVSAEVPLITLLGVAVW